MDGIALLILIIIFICLIFPILIIPILVLGILLGLMWLGKYFGSSSGVGKGKTMSVSEINQLQNNYQPAEQFKNNSVEITENKFGYVFSDSAIDLEVNDGFLQADYISAGKYPIPRSRSTGLKSANNQNFKPIPEKFLDSAFSQITKKVHPIPFWYRGIVIDRALVQATLEILNHEKTKELPQNCRNDIKERTPDGLDRRIKEYLKSDLRTANIITDVLESAGIARNITVVNPSTGRFIKGTKLNPEWTWE